MRRDRCGLQRVLQAVGVKRPNVVIVLRRHHRTHNTVVRGNADRFFLSHADHLAKSGFGRVGAKELHQ